MRDPSRAELPGEAGAGADPGADPGTGGGGGPPPGAGHEAGPGADGADQDPGPSQDLEVSEGIGPDRDPSPGQEVRIATRSVHVTGVKIGHVQRANPSDAQPLNPETDQQVKRDQETEVEPSLDLKTKKGPSQNPGANPVHNRYIIHKDHDIFDTLRLTLQMKVVIPLYPF